MPELFTTARRFIKENAMSATGIHIESEPFADTSAGQPGPLPERGTRRAAIEQLRKSPRGTRIVSLITQLGMECAGLDRPNIPALRALLRCDLPGVGT